MNRAQLRRRIEYSIRCQCGNGRAHDRLLQGCFDESVMQCAWLCSVTGPLEIAIEVHVQKMTVRNSVLHMAPYHISSLISFELAWFVLAQSQSTLTHTQLHSSRAHLLQIGVPLPIVKPFISSGTQRTMMPSCESPKWRSGCMPIYYRCKSKLSYLDPMLKSSHPWSIDLKTVNLKGGPVN